MLHQIQVGASRLSVDVIGKGEIGVLFVHGLGSNRGCWHRATDYFDRNRYRLILPDLPGFGGSEVASEHDYSMSALGCGLRAVVDALAPSEWHVVAHSMGGAAVLSLLSDGGRIASSFASAEGNLVAQDAFLSRKVARLSEQAFVKAYPKWVELVQNSLRVHQNDQHMRYAQSLLQSSPIAVYRAACACFRASCSGELVRRFAELSCPVAYVYGEQTRRGRGIPEVAQLPRVQRFEVPLQDHFMMESADCFYRWVRQWVDSASQSKG